MLCVHCKLDNHHICNGRRTGAGHLSWPKTQDCDCPTCAPLNNPAPKHESLAEQMKRENWCRVCRQHNHLGHKTGKPCDLAVSYGCRCTICGCGEICDKCTHHDHDRCVRKDGGQCACSCPTQAEPKPERKIKPIVDVVCCACRLGKHDQCEDETAPAGFYMIKCVCKEAYHNLSVAKSVEDREFARKVDTLKDDKPTKCGDIGSCGHCEDKAQPELTDEFKKAADIEAETPITVGSTPKFKGMIEYRIWSGIVYPILRRVWKPMTYLIVFALPILLGYELSQVTAEEYAQHFDKYRFEYESVGIVALLALFSWRWWVLANHCRECGAVPYMNTNWNSAIIQGKRKWVCDCGAAVDA